MKVFFATPCYRSDPKNALGWAARCANELGLEGAVACVETMNPILEAAREALLANFRDSDCDSLLWRDDDIDIAFKDIGRLLCTPGPIVIAPYRKRISDTLVWVKEGFGCTLIQRYVIDKMEFVYTQLHSVSEGRTLVGLFDPLYIRREDGTYKKAREDEAFFMRARKLGFNSVELNNVTVVHAGLTSHFVKS